MCERYIRTEGLIGSEGLSRLRAARVAVFGIGGVGGYAAECLARCGVGAIDLIDGDTVSLSNLNRQLVALTSTVGRPKSEIMAERIRDIDPDCRVTAHHIYYTAETADSMPLSDYDYIIDAIDMVSAKLLLIERAQAAGVPLISCMGAGNKSDPTAFAVADISRTSVCPLARIMRVELRRRGIEHQKVVFSTEPPMRSSVNDTEQLPGKKTVPGSMIFTVAAAGILLAKEAVYELLKGITKEKKQ